MLSIISLCTDMGSEMLYPVLPLYLQSIGYSVVFIGILEGVAEAITGLSKGYFGKRSDLMGRRVPFVQFGYLISVIAKPMMIAFVYPLWVFFTRTLDRLGKGIRTGARDAMLSDEATLATKGKVFGFHRALDTMGAVLGPLIALIYLHYHPADYKTLFLIAVIPGALVMIVALFLKESPKTARATNGKTFFSFLRYWNDSPKQYRKVVTGLLIFALFNSSDVFLLLRLKEAGLDDTHVIGVFIFYNLIYAIFAFPLGALADKIGLKLTFTLGLLMFGIMYFGMAFELGLYAYVALFACYGIFSAATEGIAKAWITNIAAKEDTATAIGLYSGFQSIALMLASTITGVLWFKLGPMFAFLNTALIAFGVMIYFALLKPDKSEGKFIR